ncbi:hypothetical protein E4P40_13345 [Blastococcus sp. CT_GayMR20]|uniref:hypothetical protein n=1 Tax=Blastococcus sp. CT_GayMR20 TaxID=2559609 RepID=UPI001072F38C|nr:hypothetical protein [Blastococcus sp. CT_GayMR20]TFV86073.1 hypothetical protein E4P40_13345 [Blastococcus sp. CT_GayMR20]
MTNAARTSGIPTPERVFYGVVCLAATFVAVLGYLAPERMDAAFTWAELPPLHARFVATLYLFGAVFLFTALLARRARSVRPAMGGIAIFTGVLFLVTVRNLEAFDFTLVPVWVWTASYVVYPLVALAFLWTRRGRREPEHSEVATVGWVRGVLLAHALVFGVLGLLMFLMPDLMVDAWPWPVTSGVVQAYSSPFLTVAFCAGAYADRRVWPDVGVLLPALFVLEAGTLAVSLAYTELFPVEAVATWVWFGGFLLGALSVGAALVARVTTRPVPIGAAPLPR